MGLRHPAFIGMSSSTIKPAVHDRDEFSGHADLKS